MRDHDNRYTDFDDDIQIMGTTEISILNSIRYLGTAKFDSKRLTYAHKTIRIIDATCWSILVSIIDGDHEIIDKLKQQLCDEIETFYKIADLHLRAK